MQDQKKDVRTNESVTPTRTDADTNKQMDASKKA